MHVFYKNPQDRAGIRVCLPETFTNRDVCDEPTWTYSRRVSGGRTRVAATTDGARPKGSLRTSIETIVDRGTTLSYRLNTLAG